MKVVDVQYIFADLIVEIVEFIINNEILFFFLNEFDKKKLKIFFVY